MNTSEWLEPPGGSRGAPCPGLWFGSAAESRPGAGILASIQGAERRNALRAGQIPLLQMQGSS